MKEVHLGFISDIIYGISGIVKSVGYRPKKCDFLM